MKRLILLALILCAASTARAVTECSNTSLGNGAICVTGFNASNAGTGTSLSITATGATTSEEAIITLWYCGNSASCAVAVTVTSALTETAGSATCVASDHSPYTTTQSGFESRYYVYLCHGLSSGSITWKHTFSNTTEFAGSNVSLWTGLGTVFDPANVDSSVSGTAASVSVSTSSTTTNASDLVFGTEASATTAGTTGTGYTNVVSGDLADEGKTVTSAASQTATWTSSSGAWFAVIAPVELAAAASCTGLTNMTLLGDGCT